MSELPPTPPSSPTSSPKPRVDASMRLINELLAAPLDPGYAAAAQRRAQRQAERGDVGQPPRRSMRARLSLLVAAVVMGLCFGVAISTLRVPAQARAAERGQLAQRVEAVNTGVAQRTQRVTALREEIAQFQDARTDAAGQALADRTAALELQSALVAVSGPGLVVTLDDAPTEPGDPAADQAQRGGQFASGRIVSRDLQAVANALWAEGAEAIAINDHRLTGMTAIRFAGQAILVGYRPLTRPYVVTAIGSPELAARFERGQGGDYLRELSTAYGASTNIKASEKLTVPAGTTLSPRYATPAPTTPPASGAPARKDAPS